jgi:hypothetical protein
VKCSEVDYFIRCVLNILLGVLYSFISNPSHDRSTASSKTSVFGKRLCRKSDNVAVYG